MKNTFKIIIIALFLSITAHTQTFDTYYNGIVSNVSVSNIINDLTTFESFGVKEVGTMAQTNTKDWIVGRYQSLGYTDIVEQPFNYNGGASNNIIVTKIGSVYPNTFLIIDAHYDTLNGPGTNDNGSGTVLLLELARLLKNIDTEYSIKLIHFSGEEAGLVGSQYYVDNTVIPNNLDIRLVLNIDQVGGVAGLVNDTIVCEKDTSMPMSNNSDSEVATLSLATCFDLYSNLNTEISHAYGSDYMPFENNGEVITGLYEKNETTHSHSSTDLLVNMDPTYLTEVTKGALGTALYFAVAYDTASTTDDEFDDAIKIYPNPSKGKIFIEFEQPISEPLDIKIVNILGKEVFRSKLITNKQELNLQQLNKSIYICLIGNDTFKVTIKLIIK